jgi:hypothetical protein
MQQTDRNIHLRAFDFMPGRFYRDKRVFSTKDAFFQPMSQQLTVRYLHTYIKKLNLGPHAIPHMKLNKNGSWI